MGSSLERHKEPGTGLRADINAEGAGSCIKRKDPCWFLWGQDRMFWNRWRKRLKDLFPNLDIVYSYSPPFRPMTDEEDNEVVQQIQASGVRILFVGLGCPKQEIWIAEHREISIR